MSQYQDGAPRQGWPERHHQHVSLPEWAHGAVAVIVGAWMFAMTVAMAFLMYFLLAIVTTINQIGSMFE